ncbi:MAG: CSLREA domain-containing protein [Chloroflexota bacterium]
MLTGHRFALARTFSVLAAVLALLAIAGAHPAHAVVTITVNSNLDDTNVNGACTLREAITAANTNANVDTCMGQGGSPGDVIEFNIGTGTPEIDVGNPVLPPITESVTIEGLGVADKVFIKGPAGNAASGLNGFTIEQTASGTHINDMMIEMFPDDGVLIDADEVTLAHDYIEYNQGFGVQVKANGDHVGAADSSGLNCPYACDLITGNTKANVLLDTDASGAHVEGVYIGTDMTGASLLPGPTIDGVIDKGSNDTIGGTAGTTPGGSYCSGACNVIVGVPEGVLIETSAVNAKVIGNYIGIDGAGENALVTTGDSWGVISRADGVTIGGTTPEARNVISGARDANVLVGGTGSVVEGNYIGTQATGTQAIPSSWGVQAYQAVNTTIGGTASGAGNVIAGAGVSEVDVFQSTGVKVEGNSIGVDSNGDALASGGDGVAIEQGSSGNTIGGTAGGAGNTIANSANFGVLVDNAATTVHNNSIRHNSIYANGNAGISLMAGANDNILPPTITGENPLTGTACANCSIDIFSDAAGQGRIYEGSAQADNGGAWTFSGVLTGPHATATATDAANNTSAFSLPFTLTTTPTPTPTPIPTAAPTPTSTPTGPFVQGDVNCRDSVNAVDTGYMLWFTLGLNEGLAFNCYSLGDTNAPGGYAWGDLNCDGAVTSTDALFPLAYMAGLTLPTVGANCVATGDTFP